MGFSVVIPVYVPLIGVIFLLTLASIVYDKCYRRVPSEGEGGVPVDIMSQAPTQNQENAGLKNKPQAANPAPPAQRNAQVELPRENLQL